ncbi:uncharacterized protein LOC129720692 [Wyeomyia smithii]|uniref:uncharacterized protein LOC129720692 n=1 Tax=Wyeomyia smithii TaxID=174621 RepID=UPI002467D82E|nr:uncharacterized protein LOC129720692 [Wyeomyia smithii]
MTSGPAMDSFWNCLSKDVGRVPDTIRHVLEVTEYINAALAYIGNDEISAIEQDIRQLPEIMGKSARDSSMQKYFGRFVNAPERFRFMAGERAILKLIASCIQRKGINHYLRFAEKREKDWMTQGTHESNAQEVRRKIIDFYNERCDGSAEQIDFCNRVADIRVEILDADDGGLVARVRCVFCSGENDISCRPERVGGNWKVSNYLSHVRNVHKAINAPASIPRLSGNRNQSNTSPPIECTGEGSNLCNTNSFPCEPWTNSNDVSSSNHENMRKRSLNSFDDFEFVVKEEQFGGT